MKQGTVKTRISAIGKYQAPDPASEERERLILEHLPQVRLIARRIHERLPESVNLEDLISTGTIGLIAAIDRFDPRHNLKLRQLPTLPHCLHDRVGRTVCRQIAGRELRGPQLPSHPDKGSCGF